MLGLSNDACGSSRLDYKNGKIQALCEGTQASPIASSQAPTSTPSNAEQARSVYSSIVAAYPTATPNILITLENTHELTLGGLNSRNNNMLTLLGFEYDPSIDGFNNSSPPVPYPIYPELGVPTPLTVLSKVSGEERSNLYPIHLHTWQEAPSDPLSTFR